MHKDKINLPKFYEEL